jgi:hypothetical protein
VTGVVRRTFTSRVLDALRNAPDTAQWRTMREIADWMTERGQPATVGQVAASLANLECDRDVQVDRSKRPYRYRWLAKPSDGL